MAFAKVDQNRRIVEWSYERLNEMDVEFSNGEYVDEKCVSGVEDFRIVDGIAVFDPLEREPTLEELMAILLGVTAQ